MHGPLGPRLFGHRLFGHRLFVHRLLGRCWHSRGPAAAGGFWARSTEPGAVWRKSCFEPQPEYRSAPKNGFSDGQKGPDGALGKMNYSRGLSPCGANRYAGAE